MHVRRQHFRPLTDSNVCLNLPRSRPNYDQVCIAVGSAWDSRPYTCGSARFPELGISPDEFLWSTVRDSNSQQLKSLQHWPGLTVYCDIIVEYIQALESYYYGGP